MRFRIVIFLLLLIPFAASAPPAGKGGDGKSPSEVDSRTIDTSRISKGIGIRVIDSIKDFWRPPETRDDTYMPPPPCAEEEVRSAGDDPILAHDCKRVVCDGYFWGKSAIDFCCEPAGETERICHLRQPKTPESGEPWVEVRFPMQFEPGYHGIPEDPLAFVVPESSQKTSPIDILIQSAMAEDLVGEAWSRFVWDNQWSYEQKAIVANLLGEVANRLRVALESNDVAKIGEHSTALRAYAESALLTSRFAQYAISPEPIPCPYSGMESLCEMTGEYYPYFAGFGIIAAAVGVNVTSFNSELRLEGHPELRGIVTAFSAHEAE